MVDGREKVGNIAWERDGSVDTVYGWEAVGNRLGRVPLGRSETSVDTGRIAWEIAWGELRWEEVTY